MVGINDAYQRSRCGGCCSKGAGEVRQIATASAPRTRAKIRGFQVNSFMHRIGRKGRAFIFTAFCMFMLFGVNALVQASTVNTCTEAGSTCASGVVVLPEQDIGTNAVMVCRGGAFAGWAMDDCVPNGGSLLFVLPAQMVSTDLVAQGNGVLGDAGEFVFYALATGGGGGSSGGGPTLQQIFETPVAADLQQMWMIFFSLPMIVYLSAWALGQVVSFLNSRSS